MNGLERSHRPSSRQGETAEQFEDKTLRAIFRLTLDPSQTKDQHGHILYPLPELREELESDGKDLRLTTDLLEQAIMEAGRSLGKITPHDWLFSCWKRANRFSKSVKDRSPDNQKWAIVSEARRLCVSWCIFSITLPDMFGQEYNGTTALADHLLADPEEDTGIDHDFLTEAVARFDEDETIKAAFVAAIEDHSIRLGGLTMDSDYRKYTAMLRQLIRFYPNSSRYHGIDYVCRQDCAGS